MNLLELLANLGITIEATTPDAITDDDLTAAEASLAEAYASAREAADIERCTAIVDAIEAVRTEVTARADAAVAAEALLADLDARVAPPAAGPEDRDEGGDDGTTDVVAEAEAVAEAAAEEREPVSAASTPPVTGGEPGTVRRHIDAQNRAAAARRMAMPTAPPAAPTPSRSRTTVTAGADLTGYTAGQAIPDMRAMGQAAADRIHSLSQAKRGNPSMGGRYLVASVQADWPEERTLGSDPTVNIERINEAVTAAANASPEAITAAGGLCAPVEVRYDMFGIGDDRRPIRDALVRFNASRGGVRWIASPRLSDVASAVVVWTEANDTTPSSPTTKPCTTITCGTETEALIDAVTKCLQVGNFSRRTFPEQFAEWWRLAGVEHAREAEQNLFARMVATSSQATTGEVLGAGSDILENVGQAAAAYRSRHRMAADATLRAILPQYVVDLIQADAVRRMPGDNAWGWTRAQIDAFFGVRDIVVTWSPDVGVFGAQTDGAALLRWPDTVQGLLFAEGTHLFLDGGELDFGMEIRDSTLNSLNNVQAFMETFEGTAQVGVESIDLTMNVCPDGSSSALIDISPCTTGS